MNKKRLWLMLGAAVIVGLLLAIVQASFILGLVVEGIFIFFAVPYIFGVNLYGGLKANREVVIAAGEFVRTPFAKGLAGQNESLDRLVEAVAELHRRIGDDEE